MFDKVQNMPPELITNNKLKKQIQKKAYKENDEYKLSIYFTY